MKTVEGRPKGEGKKAAVIVSRWNEFVTKELLEGALDELHRCGCESVKVIKVPGTWEMPPTAAKLLTGKNRPDVIIALGCIIVGETIHGKLLSGDVSSALMSLQVQHQVPIGWGVLTPDDTDQAMNRAGLKMGNKGREAVLAALEAADIQSQLS